MNQKFLLVFLGLALVVIGYVTTNEDLNRGYISWVNDRKGIKSKITHTTLQAAKGPGYFLMAIGVVLCLSVFF